MPGFSISARLKSLPLTTLVFVAALSSLGARLSAEGAGNPFDKLNGAWSGGGTVKTKDGTLKKVDCKADYKATGNNLSQTLHCTGNDYEINAKMKLTDKDGKVKGNWNEAIYDASGGITGKAHDDIIRAVISGDKFSGRMSLKVSDAGLSLNMLQLNQDSGTYRLVTSLLLHR
jgi:hypothetical protein